MTRRFHPAVLLVCAMALPPAFAGTGPIVVCLDPGSSQSFKEALSQAETDGMHNDIRLRAGMFAAPLGGFDFLSTESYDLTISGGWNAGCTSTRGNDYTILDGAGNKWIMRLNNFNGKITVRGITFENGYWDGSIASALAVNDNIFPAGTGATVELNRFFFNITDGPSAGAGAVQVSTNNGQLRLRNNLFFGNTGGSGSAAMVTSHNDVETYISNNTVVGNGTNDFDIGGVWVAADSPDNVILTNNIMWANFPIDLLIPDGALLLANDIEVYFGEAASASVLNLSEDPGFAPGLLQFTLAPSSALINAGLNNPAGGNTASDLAGRPRIQGGIIDMGAYELPDVIFADDFE